MPVGVYDQSGKKARRLGQGPDLFGVAIASKLVLDEPPKNGIDDCLLLPRIDFALMANLAVVDRVLQQIIECAAGKLVAA